MIRRRTALSIAGVILLAGLAGVLAFHSLVDPERLKRVARAKAAAAWSRDLAIDEVSLRIFPVPALLARGVALANPPWAKGKKLVEVETLIAEFEILPLLLGKTRVKSLDLDGVKASLEVAADGRASWSMEPGPAAKPGAGGEENVIALESLSIHNADIVYRPRAGKPGIPWHVEEANASADPGLRNVRVEAELARRGRPLKVKAAFDELARAGRPGATTEGTVDLDWGDTQLALAGRLPLGPGLKGQLLRADLKSKALNDLLAFNDISHGRTAPLEAHVETREAQGWIEVTQLTATLGKFRMRGEGKISPFGPKTVVKARVETEFLDWARTLLEAGEPPAPALEPEEMFRDIPLAWPLLVALQGSEGTLDVRLGKLLLRNGVDLRNTRATMAFDGDRVNVGSFTTELLGGTGAGSMAIEGRRKSARVSFEGTNLLLERWFRERGSAIPFKAGPMKVKASLASSGDSLRDLAANVSGPLSIRMGPGVWASEKAGHAESVMVSAFSPSGATAIQFECIGAMLPFKSGRATSKALVGARSTATQILTSGFVDMREEVFELRGRVRSKTSHVGLATVAGDIMIGGKIRHPHASLDPVSTPGVIARAGAAIATAGLSLVGTAMADAANAKKSDPCEAVFSPG